MTTTGTASYSVGDRLPSQRFGPVTAAMIAEFASASGDDNPHALDADAALAAGLDGVVAHGMLSMAWLGRALATWAPGHVLLDWCVRFVAPTRPGDIVACSATVVDITPDAEGERVQMDIEATTERGVATLRGTATLRRAV
jgi:acyl dehydratase